jgi:hypothetical protein
LVLIWQNGLTGLTAQVAESQGDGETTQVFNVDHNLLIKAQALALQDKWQYFLQIKLSEEGGASIMGREIFFEAMYVLS